MGTCVFLISDTHFGHENILGFKRNDGTTLRDFKTIEEMDETIINNWNSVVRPQDHVYHLGDVVIHRAYLNKLGRCNGHKRLVRGNHDIFKTKFYLEYFEEIYGVRVFEDMILSHIPLHPDCLRKRWPTNVHGHLHSNTLGDKRYINVSVEQINYTPISIEDVRKIIKE